MQDNPVCVLAETEIVELDGKTISVAVKLVERYAPKQSLYIEGHDLPSVFLDHGLHRIKLASGTASLCVFLGSFSLNHQVETGKIHGRLVPTRTPCAAIVKETRLRSATFGIFNFPAFRSHPPKVIEYNNRVCFEGITKFVTDRFCVDIEPLDDIRKREDMARTTQSIYQSHKGTVNSTSSASFSAGELIEFLNDIRRFLSFLRRASVGINAVMAVDFRGTSRIARWGMEHVTPGDTPQHQLLLSPISAGNDMADIFPGFYREVMSSHGDTVRLAMDQYIEGNSVNFMMGIPNAQAILEALARLLGPWKGARTSISEVLRDRNILLNVPKDFTTLRQFVAKNNFTDGLVGLVKLRNMLTHSPTKVYSIPPFTFLDACELGQWFIEMLLFHMFNYRGRYRSRLVRNRDDNPYRNVPWVTNNGLNIGTNISPNPEFKRR